MASGLPWAVAAIALVALIALVVGQRFGSRGTSAPESSAENAVPQSAPFAGATGSMPRAPDISQLTPAQRAERLYDRIMRESEAGNTENVRAFMPMAIQAYDMIGPLNLDQRYDLGRLGEVAGDSALARAEADTILAARPTHLLGLALAARAARMENSTARAQAFDVKLLAAEPAERKVGLPEYLLHNNDIQTAVAAARASNK